MSLRTFQRPLTVAEGCIFMRVIWTLHDVAAARHVILAVGRTVQFVGVIAAVVLLVAFERRVNALAVRAVERTCGVIPSRRIMIPFHVKYRQRPAGRYTDRLCRLQFTWTDLPEGQALARHMKGRSDSHVVSSHVCRSSVKETSTHSPDCGFGCLDAQKPTFFCQQCENAVSVNVDDIAFFLEIIVSIRNIFGRFRKTLL